MDADKLERVQRRFRRMLPRLEGLTYRERSDRLGISLQWRRTMGDLRKVSKITGGIDRADSDNLLVGESSRVGESRTKGHWYIGLR